MANSNEWQCVNCGDHPSSFIGEKPSSSGRCQANGAKHVWDKIECGSTNPRDWACKYCGTKPSSFVGNKPSSGAKCSSTGVKHVWIRA